ncbi:MAG: hypothetical protein J0J04_07685 [Microbacterium sp.]|uniref:hypothetical protein n=1 Tax=Microbacterium sp. TaxID=51671 RepID=UPI001ACE6B5B|nr:hypothetical protein [Microbacterium sp.]MBN9214679.1 hypothetical protein [Microbacterium sp.]
MRFAIAALPHTFPLRDDPGAIDLARHWATADAQTELLEHLEQEFDGFAVSTRFDSGIQHPEVWSGERAVLWSHLVPPPDPFKRAQRTTEAVIIRSPRTPLYAPATSVSSGDVLRRGQTAKSAKWTRWVLAHLGAIPGEDTVVDFFTRQPVPAFTTMLTLEGIHA